ncbi:MAG: TlyA family RNA methyltransferase [Desulfobulbus sp.]|uniref:TlyA family RNA methyltransferase n=1 Tax=Desulfobulbus sp. TaxID=895 RepID=UPI002841842F|nr:TlyA family RNA methyltransferase [Desulfobulbus sp.]MDR2550574.1 TlyA family RNA methyltransferase [Desulfobulbus sp.]
MSVGKRKQRLDTLLVALGLADDIEAAQRLIGAGLVLVDTRICDKAGQAVAMDSLVALKTARRRFVSRGGEKLDGALDAAGIDPGGWVCTDIGCSTGGFTDCLLQRGARKVYSVDVGYGLLDWKLRQDERVQVLERTNARHLTCEQIADPLDFAVIDASFISLEPLLAPLLPLFREVIRIFALVKPQFQLPREAVGPGGIVSDPALHRQALGMVRQFGASLGLHCAAMVASSIRGAKGNQEFFMLLTGTTGPARESRKNEEEGEQ